MNVVVYLASTHPWCFIPYITGTTGSFSFIAEHVYSYRRSYYEFHVSVVTDVTWGFGVWWLDHFKWNEIRRSETDEFHKQRFALVRMQSLASTVLENLFNIRVSFLVWRHFINSPSDVLMRRVQCVCEAVQDSRRCAPSASQTYTYIWFSPAVLDVSGYTRKINTLSELPHWILSWLFFLFSLAFSHFHCLHTPSEESLEVIFLKARH